MYASNATSSFQILSVYGVPAESFSEAKAVTINNDIQAPTVNSVTTEVVDGTYSAGQDIPLKVEFSEPVTVASGVQSTLTLETGAIDSIVEYTSGSGTDTLVYTYTVTAGDTSADLTYVNTSSLTGQIADLYGNAAVLTLPDLGSSGDLATSSDIVVDSKSPDVTSIKANAGTKTVTIELDEAVSVNTASTGDFSATSAGSSISIDAVSASENAITLTLGSYVQNGQVIYVAYANSSVSVNEFTDDAGNALETFSGTRVIVTNDELTPTVSSIVADKVDGTYKATETIPINVTFSEPVTVTGTPTLTLETGATDAVVDYASGDATNTLVFSYTVASGNTSADLDYASVSALSGTIKDLAGNDATLTLPSPICFRFNFIFLYFFIYFIKFSFNYF